MAKIINIPDNFIGKEDREKLESFGGHEIAHGRATRWHWDKNTTGSDVFEIYRGGANEQLVVRISRDREHNTFCANNVSGKLISSGALDHIMAELDRFFAQMHKEDPA
ncbi:hypothetical protein [Kaarinaea lacus]